MRSGVAPRETVPKVIEPSQSGTCALTSGSTSRLSVVSIKVLIKGHSCATIWFIHSADSIASSWPASTRAAASISDVVAVSTAAMVPAVAEGKAGRGWGGGDGGGAVVVGREHQGSGGRREQARGWVRDADYTGGGGGGRGARRQCPTPAGGRRGQRAEAHVASGRRGAAGVRQQPAQDTVSLRSCKQTPGGSTQSQHSPRQPAEGVRCHSSRARSTATPLDSCTVSLLACRPRVSHGSDARMLIWAACAASRQIQSLSDRARDAVPATPSIGSPLRWANWRDEAIQG